MEKESFYTSDGLEKLWNIIKRFSFQGTSSYRSGEAEVEYIYNYLSGFSWKKPSLTHCYANYPHCKFHELYTAFDSAWLQEKKFRMTQEVLVSFLLVRRFLGKVKVWIEFLVGRTHQPQETIGTNTSTLFRGIKYQMI